MIKRTDHSNFWQSVTGSLEWGESAPAAAQRELCEETGISGASIRQTGIRRSYAILPQWLQRYPPHTLRNHEHLFFCKLDNKPEIQLDPSEHSELLWMGFQEARERVFSWSNKLALAMLES